MAGNSDMKKAIILLALVVSVSSLVFAGPFGLSNGMTLAEVTRACDGVKPIHIENDSYAISPKQKHSSFTTYIVWISDEYGLYRIRAASDEIKTNDYGSELKSAFYSFLPRLEKTYGKQVVFDGMIDKTSIWSDDRYWFTALGQGARGLFAIWSPLKGEQSIKDDITSIMLQVTKSSYDSGILLLDYEFLNQEFVQDDEDNVL